MSKTNQISHERRTLLAYLAASPLFSASLLNLSSSNVFAQQEALNPFYKTDLTNVISSVEEALNVFDFEKVAHKVLPPAHYGYVATGVDDNLTEKANREAFSTIKLRARRLVDFSSLDMSVKLFGETWPSPIALAPVSSQSSMNPEGEVATARACKKTQSLQMYSTFSSKAIEEVNEAYGRPVWFQLYAAKPWQTTLKLIRRAETAGCTIMVLTVDMLGGSNRELFERYRRADNRDCQSCHIETHFRSKPMTRDINYEMAELLSWDYLKRLKDNTKMKVLVKGIVTAEDAKLSIENGADGIIVSNHGGRAAETGRGTIECLPEVVDAVGGKVPVLIDSGFRRGTDVFKALALGADAICIGRPFMWGLAAFGEQGVATVIKLLRAELALIMKKTGGLRCNQIDSSFLT
ncbi:MAG: 4-hydroxymandelate oxidase [Planctomycetota bacterium]|jgi:4-hydroxymandelate oxidase